MNEPNQNQAEAINPGGLPPFPEGMMTASASELTDVALQVVEGKLPHDLHGHVFIVAPVGSVNSGGLPNPDGTHVWNGNGMIYRLDFHKPGEVWLKTRIAKSPCYYADKATRPGSRYDKYQFRDYGMARFSLHLGMRDQLNTAFLPMKFSGEENERLLVTFDGGRPYEIDLETLEVVTAVGTNKEWCPGMQLNIPFQPVLSTAHPCFDARTEEMFTVNYGRSLANFLETIGLVYELEKLPQEVEELLEAIASFFDEQDFVKKIFDSFSQFSQGIWQFLQGWLEKLFGIADFVYLIRWNGVGEFERWKLVLPDGKPVRIEQTMHQIAVSRDYVVLMDTCLKFGMEQILNNPISGSKQAERLLRKLLTRSQLPDTSIYIVRRDRLKAGQHPAYYNDKEVEVVAHKVVLPLEAAHFLVDYDNPNGQITLHVAHECATDVSEWVRRYDSAYDGKPASPHLEGMLSVGAMDIGRLGRYVIDAEKAEILESKVLFDTKRTWGLSLYTYRDTQSSGTSTDKIENIYWQSFGFWQELLTEFIFDLYKNYKYRVIPLEQLLDIPDSGKGRPSCLFRLDTKKMAIADSYEFPLVSKDQKHWDSHIMNSPQFVPSANSNNDSTDGYIVCTVVSQHGKEIWIFNAQSLAQGPLCKLSHPSVNFGYTIHTTWLPKIKPRTANYKVPVRQDYEELVNHKSPEIQGIFSQEVYPYFDRESRNT